MICSLLNHLLFILNSDGNNHSLNASHSRRQYQSLIIAMMHDHHTNRTGSDSPTSLPYEFLFLFLIFKLNAKHFGKVLSQIMTGSCLNGTTIFRNPCLDSSGSITSSKFLRLGFDALVNGDS